MNAPLVYKSLDSILDVLEKPENKARQEIHELLNIYQTTKETTDQFDASGEVKKHPLIVLEGLDGSGKSTCANRFSKKIKGVQWQTPPKSISHLRHLLDDNIQLRTAFYSLGNYICSMEVQNLLRSSPVVMDRYWHSTAAFAIAQAVQDYPNECTMPPKGDEIYEWPHDLFKPDIVMLVDVDETIRLQRISNRKDFTTQEKLLRDCEQFRNNVILGYRNFYNPEVTFINGNLYPNKMMVELSTYVNPLLNVKN